MSCHKKTTPAPSIKENIRNEVHIYVKAKEN